MQLLVLSALVLVLVGCSYRNEEEIQPAQPQPVPDTVRFSQDVKPLFQQHGCIGCHGATTANAGVQLHEHAEALAVVQDSSLLGSIRHEPGYSNMPQGGDKLPPEAIALIEKWVAQGAPDN
jgi:mono/diheme cytochrome c family protein